MSRYTSVQLGPTDGQLSDLAEGHAVHLAPAHMKGDVTFHLTKTQVAKLDKAREAGKGCKLSLSPAQVKHMGQHGSGRFADMLKRGKEFLKGAARKGIKTGLQVGKDWVENKILDKTGLSGDGFLSNLAKKAAHGLVDVAADHFGSGFWDFLGGSVTAPQKKQLMAMHAMHGSGFFSNILKKVAHGGVDLLANAVGGRVGQPSMPGQMLTHAQVRQLRAIEAQHGRGFFSNLLKKVAHSGVDLIGNVVGGGVQNHSHGPAKCDHCGSGVMTAAESPNEGLRAALMQKKVGASLYLP